MNRFSWYDAKTIEEAQAQADATISQVMQPGAPERAAVFKAGGIDLLDLMKEGLAKPGKLVNIRNIAGLGGIEYHEKRGLRIGANVTISEIEKDEHIKARYRALYLCAARTATPHIRNMATLGGNLLQRTRCWYFRSLYHQCLRKGGDTCYARIGEHQYHAIMRNDSCVSVHASSLATVLMAWGAVVEVADPGGERREVPIARFFVHPDEDITKETVLGPGEIVTAVRLPPVSSRTRSFYIAQGIRASQDWPLAEVAVVMELAGKQCVRASVALGAAAPVPLLSEAAAKALTGETVDEKRAETAAKMAMKISTPLEKNRYRIPIFEATVKRAILRCLEDTV